MLVVSSVAGGAVARAADQAPFFKGRCVASHYASADLWQARPKLNMVADIPVACTGVLRGARVTSRLMRVAMSGYPTLVQCQGTSIAPHAGILLLEPRAAGGTFTNHGLMRIDNAKRTVTFNGVRLASVHNLRPGTINGSFKFAKPLAAACKTATYVRDFGVTGSITFS
jgi:hypothetical protein